MWPETSLNTPPTLKFPAPIEYPSFGGGGGGGGGGDGEPGINHTGDEDVDTTPYGELNLVLGEEPMHELTIGDTPLELTLELDVAEGLGGGCKRPAAVYRRTGALD